MSRRALLRGLPALLASACAWASEPAGAPNWVLTQDGAFAVHLHDHLAWTRCVEGMQWEGGTCTGKPLLATYAEAVALAATRKAIDGVDWRLPSVIELQRVVSRGAKPTAAETALFPGAPRDWYWSGTAKVDATQVNPYNYGNIAQGRTSAKVNESAPMKGWAVNLLNGQARGDVNKRSRLLVRLVSSQD